VPYLDGRKLQAETIMQVKNPSINGKKPDKDWKF
jgi:hypothetical protein